MEYLNAFYLGLLLMK